MPFTFAHPAAILPLTYLPRRYVSVTGLIAGALVPDIEYFMRLTGISYYSHTWWGVFWLDLPLAILSAFVFHNITRDELIQNLPASALLRCARYFGWDWNTHFRKHWWAVIASILLGAASHLLWDNLTHEGAERLGRHLTATNWLESVKNIGLYYSYWGLNTLVGMGLLAVRFWKLPVQRKWKIRSSDASFWPLVIIITTSVLVARFIWDDSLNIIELTDTAISGVILALLIVPLIQKRRRKEQKRKRARSRANWNKFKSKISENNSYYK